MGSVGGVPLSVSGTVGRVEVLAFGGKPFPVKVVVGTNGATVEVEGQMGGAGDVAEALGEWDRACAFAGGVGSEVRCDGQVAEFAADVQTHGRTPRDWLVNLAGQVRVTQGTVVVGGGTRIEVEHAGVAEWGWVGCGGGGVGGGRAADGVGDGGEC